MGESLNHNTFLGIYEGVALKLEKVVPVLSSFNPCQSLPSVTTEDRKQFPRLKIVLNNKSGPLFLEFGRCEGKFWPFKKIENSVI